MSYETMTLVEIKARLDPSDHPDQARLALDALERARAIVEDPKYDPIDLGWLSSIYEVCGLRHWAAQDNVGNENDL